MPRREPAPPHDSDPLKGGLKHNPLAALGGERREPAAVPAAQPPTRAADESSTRERVTVRLERTGRGGKTVTIAEGPGLARRELDSLAREIAAALGVGARVEDASIAVQGDQRERLAAWLAVRGFAFVARGN